MRTGTAHLPLHGGKAPRWLFTRMVALSREILRVMVEEYGPAEVLTRVADPHWFRALGWVLSSFEEAYIHCEGRPLWTTKS
jgi:hypothetical protein